jgi:heme/copper-type cytochrome/quinol oxidase subunit 2
MEFLINLTLALLGMIIYFLWKARNYMGDGSFCWKKWKKENLHRLIYSAILLLVIVTAMTLAPETAKVLQMIGIDIRIDDQVDPNAAPLVVGYMLSSLVMGASKSIVHFKSNKNGSNGPS